MIDPAPTLRLALDQNFPTPLIGAITDYLPVDIELKSLRRIDPRLSELDDRTLFLALHHLGWHGSSPTTTRCWTCRPNWPRSSEHKLSWSP